MKRSWWKFLVPGVLGALQIGGAVYHSFSKEEKEAEKGGQRFEIMLANPSVMQQDNDEFRCYDMGCEDAERFFFRMSGGNRIVRGTDERGKTYLTVFPNGTDSLKLLCLKDPSPDGMVAEMVLPGKGGVRKRVFFYSTPKPVGN